MGLIGSLESGVSALKSFSKGIEVIGDSIANVNTIAFKGSRVDYTDGFSNILKQASTSGGGTAAGSNAGVDQVGSGVLIGDIRTNFKQGTIQPTGINTDLAISGEGFFKLVDTISGEAFATRAGNFRIDDRNYITNQEGFRLQGAVKAAAALPTYTATLNAASEIVFTQAAPANPNAASTVGDLKAEFNISTTGGTLTNSTGLTDAAVNAAAPTLDSFEINQDGSMTFLMSNGDAFTGGQLMLLGFADPQALAREGNGRFSGFDAAGAAPFDIATSVPSTNSLGFIKSSALELSNVDLTEEFSNIITTQRSFQAGARMVSVSDEILTEIVNLKR